MIRSHAPLRIFFFFHPESTQARHLAEQLLDHFYEPSVYSGLRLPVRFAPIQPDGGPPSEEQLARLNLDSADHAIIVFLSDSSMVQAVIPSHRGREWKACYERLKQREAECGKAGGTQGLLHVFAVALDNTGYQLTSSQHVVSGVVTQLQGVENHVAQDRRLSDVSLQIAIRALHLLQNGCVEDRLPHEIEIPVSLFLSHAKYDLDKNKYQKKLVPDDPVHYVMARLKGLPVQRWFDSEKIVPGADFANSIEKAVRESTAVVVFLSDHYATRPWCRREVLAAKKYRRPILVVDALRDGESRHFPYLGNAPFLRWKGPVQPLVAEGESPPATPEQTEQAATAAIEVIDRAVREALKYLHKFLKTKIVARPHDVVLGAAPEAMTFAQYWASVGPLPSGERLRQTVFLYPDPPLAREEDELLEQIGEGTKFETPFLRRASQRTPGEARSIGVSISESGISELTQRGLTERHLQSATDEVHLYLLLAGLQVAYGGLMSGDFSKGSNFTLRLFEMARGYTRLVKEAGAAKARPIINYAPWPYRLNYRDSEHALFQLEGISDEDQYAQLVEGPDLRTPRPLAETFPKTPDGGLGLAPKTAEQRGILARGLTAMRRQMTNSVAARLLIGGKLEGFSGCHPGILEEAWFSLTNGKTGAPGEMTGPPGQPLFVIGAFGGAAGALVDVLEGRGRPELSDAHAEATVSDYRKAIQQYADFGEPVLTRDAMRADFEGARRMGLAEALNNGLDDQENRELFYCADPERIADLVLTGMTRQSSTKSEA